MQRENTNGVPIRIVEGLDIPIGGKPKQSIEDGLPVRSVALVGIDYLGLRPSMFIKEGDTVKLGQPLFFDRRYPDILFTSPGTGVVSAINRGVRRVLLSVVVDLSGTEQKTFSSWSPNQLTNLRKDQIVDTLLVSGMWTALRNRPFSKIPDPKSSPSSIFVTAMDTDPLAAKPEIVIGEYDNEFSHGLDLIARLTDGHVFVCQKPSAHIPLGSNDNVRIIKFSGPHPSGLVGTHIHFLDPVNDQKSVWHLGYQDVIAIGKLFTTGKVWIERIISLAGPKVKRPRLIRTRMGAHLDNLTQGEMQDSDCRIISGSVLSGRYSQEKLSFLGRFHNQISVIGDVSQDQPSNRSFHNNQQYSSYGFFGKNWSKRVQSSLTTALNGKSSVFFPLGGFEKVMPLDILPTQLLKALLVGDWEMAKALGCLELDEEDLALCTFVCPGKCDYGPLLRACLETIEKEG